MTERFVDLRMPVGHADAVASLLDLATRIHMGQVSEILALVDDGRLPVRDDRSPSFRRLASESDRHAVEDALRSLAAALGHPTGSHFGIAKASAEAGMGHEAMKAIRKALHDHLTPEVRHTVHSEGVVVRYASGTAPTATVDGR